MCKEEKCKRISFKHNLDGHCLTLYMLYMFTLKIDDDWLYQNRKEEDDKLLLLQSDDDDERWKQTKGKTFEQFSLFYCLIKRQQNTVYNKINNNIIIIITKKKPKKALRICINISSCCTLKKRRWLYKWNWIKVWRNEKCWRKHFLFHYCLRVTLLLCGWLVAFENQITKHLINIMKRKREALMCCLLVNNCNSAK